MTASRITNRPPSLSDPEANIHQRPQYGPPADDRRHLRLTKPARRVDLGHRDFGRSKATLDGAQIEIRLELVLVEPALVQADARLCEHAAMHGTKAVRRLGDAATRDQRKEQR